MAKGENAEEGFITLKDLCKKYSDISYQRLNRVLRGLKKAKLISPWHGPSNEFRLSPDDARILSRSVTYLKRDKWPKMIVLMIRADLAEERAKELARRVKALEEERENLLQELKEATTPTS